MRYALLLLAFCAIPTAHAEAPPIQQWINEAIQAGGGVVTIPEGEHILPAGLILKDAKKVALRGVNKERCVLKLAGQSTTPKDHCLIKLTGNCETLEIANLTLDGGNIEGERPHPLIVVDGSANAPEKPITDVTIRDCLMQHFGQALSFYNTHNSSIERCSLRDGGQAILFSDLTQDCVALGNQIIRIETAFLLQGASSCRIEGNEMRNSNVGMVIRKGTLKEPLKPHLIRNNHFPQESVGLEVSPDSAAPLLEDNENL